MIQIKSLQLRREPHYQDRIVRCFAKRPSTVDAMFHEALARGGDRIALTSSGRHISYAALDAEIERVAAGFTALGLVKGDRVALLLGNHVAFVVAFLAAARIGVISVPMNIRQRAPETLYMVNQCGAAVLMYDTALAQELPASADMPSVRHGICVGGHDGSEAISFDDLKEPRAAPTVDIGEEDLLCLLYTSGTTGRPKGAMLTHLGVIHSALHYQWAFDLGSDDAALLGVPASHVTGLVAILLTMIRCAGRTIIMESFHAPDFLHLAAREKITYTLVVPAIYNLCLLQPDFARHDLSAWRVGGFGGAPMPQATIERLAAALPALSLFNIYGSTETTSPATILPASDIATRADSVGLSLPCCDILVVDDEGRERPRGETGELWISGANVVPGYWDNADATRASFVGGYWASGDIGSIDRDGYVRVFDRKKDVINRGGFKIYSIEVENELSRHPAVLESALLSRSDPVLGEKAEAFVVLRPGASATADELRAHCAASLSDYKIPDMVHFVAGALPRNANGKIMKRELRQNQPVKTDATPAS